MARKRTGVFEDLIDVAAMLPWWLGVVLALVSYLLLHHYAALPPAPAPTDLAHLTSGIQNTFIVTLSSIFQYVVSLAFLIGAGVSGWKSTRSKSLLAAAKSSPSEDRLKSFSWREFENLVGQAFRERGYSVKELGGKGPDGGVDLELRMGADKYFVQCKHWKSQTVGVAPVRELFGVMSAEGAVGGFVVASGPFTTEATKFSEGRSIELLNASALVGGLKQQRERLVPVATSSPVCRRCGSPMVKRESRKGANAGSVFWGCSTYPDCRETLPMK